jgi:hypothetical protein
VDARLHVDADDAADKVAECWESDVDAHMVARYAERGCLREKMEEELLVG